MAFDFKKEEDVKEYLENIGIEYRFGCYSEKKPEVCHLLGMYFNVIKKDDDKAMKVYKVNCDTYNYGISCYRYAYLLDKKNNNPNIVNDEIIDYFTKGCETGGRECGAKSCYLAGVKLGKKAELEKHKEGQKEQFSKAMEFMEKACNLQLGQACFNLSSIHFTGIPEADVAKNMQKFHDYAKRGCEYKHLNSCVNMSVIYAKGEGGIKKDLDLAQKYKDISKDLYDQMQGDRGLKFSEGVNF